MELSRQMLLLTAENYGSYYLHITDINIESGLNGFLLILRCHLVLDFIRIVFAPVRRG